MYIMEGNPYDRDGNDEYRDEEARNEHLLRQIEQERKLEAQRLEEEFEAQRNVEPMEVDEDNKNKGGMDFSKLVQSDGSPYGGSIESGNADSGWSNAAYM